MVNKITISKIKFVTDSIIVLANFSGSIKTFLINFEDFCFTKKRCGWDKYLLYNLLDRFNFKFVMKFILNHLYNTK